MDSVDFTIFKKYKTAMHIEDRQRTMKTIFVILFLGFCVGFLPACEDKTAIGPVKNEVLVDKLKRVTPLYLLSYNADFATRFALPAQKAITLSKGLSAIAIEIRPQIAQIDCFVHLYLDDTVDVYVPNSNQDFSEKEFPENFFVQSYNAEDAKWNSAEMDKSRGRILYRAKSVAQGKPGWASTCDMQRFKRDFLRDLSVMSINTGCITLGFEYGPAEIVVQKAGTSDYNVGIVDPVNLKQIDKIYRFDIPEKLQSHFAGYLEYIGNFNMSGTSSMGTDDKFPIYEIP